MKVQTSREPLKDIPFLVIKKIKKQGISACNFLLTPIIVCSRYLNLLFQNLHPFILLFPFFQKISQSTGQDQQNGKEHGVNYRSSPSGLISKICPLLSL